MMRSLVVDQELRNEMGTAAAPQPVCDEVPTFWVSKNVCGDAFQLLSLIAPALSSFEAAARTADTKARRARERFPPMPLSTMAKAPENREAMDSSV